MPEPFPILTLSATDVLAPEEMGSKRKGWVRVNNDAKPWLFKYSRLSAGVMTGEAWAEKVGAEAAAALGIRAAQVELATLDGATGCVSRQFPELSELGVELVHGCDLLPGVVLGYDKGRRFRQAEHTLENILAAVARVIPSEAEREQAFRELAGFVVLDALILNTDRHHENWALLRWKDLFVRVRHKVAPSYDHASSLARNEPEEKLAGWLADRSMNRAEWYARRGHGGIYLGEEERGANPLHLAEVAARRWPEYFRPWIERVGRLEFSVLKCIMQRLPAGLISDSHREFALALLRHTQQALSAL